LRPALIAGVALSCASCGTIPSEPLPSELDRGLIVIYPGASSAPLEETLWLAALRGVGIHQAIEGVSWGVPFDNTNGAARARGAEPVAAGRGQFLVADRCSTRRARRSRRHARRLSGAVGGSGGFQQRRPAAEPDCVVAGHGAARGFWTAFQLRARAGVVCTV